MKGVNDWNLKTLNNKREMEELKESTICNISVISRIQNTEFTAWKVKVLTYKHTIFYVARTHIIIY